MGNLAGSTADGVTSFFEKLVLRALACVLFFTLPGCSTHEQPPATPIAESVNVTGNATVSGTPALPASAGGPAGYVGEIFGERVPENNYHFVRGVIAVFGNKFGPRPEMKEELDQAIWDQLLLSLVAFSQNVTVTQEEVDAEIAKTLAAEKISFDRAKDPQAYQAWLRQKAGLTPELFENQIRHLLQLAKLKNHVIDTIISPQITASDEEAYLAFLSEHNTIGLELIQFETQSAADAFYKKVAGRAAIWEREKKRYQKDIRKPGFVSLEFLIDLWGIPADAAFAMVKRPAGDIYPPRPIYKGYAVFKILEVRQADITLYAKSKEAYMEKVKAKKKSMAYNQWFAGLKSAAQIKIYGEVSNNMR